MLDLQPVGERLIAKRKEVKQVGRIIIPGTTKQMEATEGKVIAVGRECLFCKAGDNIFFGRYSGVEIERGKEKYVVMNESDIIAFIKEENNGD